MQRIADLVTFCYIRQKKALGLGHAVLTAKRVVGEEAFAVLLGDDIIDNDVPVLKQMMDVHARYPATILAIQKVPHAQTGQYGIIDAKRSRTAYTSSKTWWKSRHRPPHRPISPSSGAIS